MARNGPSQSFLQSRTAAATLISARVTAAWIAGCRATDLDRNLSAYNFRHASGRRVRNLFTYASRAIDRLRVMDRLADRIRNLSDTFLADHAAGGVRNLLRASFRHHVADAVGASLRPLLRHHVANLVVAGPLLRHHVADAVSASLRPLLRHHAANLVAAGPLLRHHVADAVGASLRALLRHHAADPVIAGSLFRHHVADAVGASLRPLFWHHAADPVSAGLGALLGDHSTNVVSASLRTRFTDVLHTIDRSLTDFRHPHLSAYLRWRALNFDHLAAAWLVDATAAARIPGPCAGRLNALADDRTGAAAYARFPVAPADIDRLRVMDRRANGVADITTPGFPNGLADRVTNVLATRFPDRLADRVTNVLAARFPDGLANGVATRLGFPDGLADGVTNVLGASFPDGLANRVAASLGFPDRLTHRVTNVLATRFPDGLANGVAASLGFPNGLANRVTYVFSAGFPDRLANRVCTSAAMRFVNWLADRISTLTVACFSNVSYAVDSLRFTNWPVARLVASVLLLLVHDLFAGLHNGVALLLTASVIYSATARLAATHTRGAAVACIGGLHCRNGQNKRHERYG